MVPIRRYYQLMQNASYLIKAVPARKTWRRALMPRQPYSEAVPSTGGRLHPFLLMVKGKAWFRIKDHPAGEGQVGQI